MAKQKDLPPDGWYAIDFACHQAAREGTYTSALPQFERGGVRVLLPSASETQASLTSCLASRRSRRRFAMDDLELPALATLLWAGWGVSGIFDEEAIAAAGFSSEDEEYGLLRGRTRFNFPSAGAIASSGVHVIASRVAGLPSGLYSFEANIHALDPVAIFRPESVLLALFGEPDWVHAAAAILVASVSVVSRAHYRHPYQLALIETGHIGQSVALAAQALGLAQCAVGDINEAAWFGLAGTSHAGQVPMLAIAVGAMA